MEPLKVSDKDEVAFNKALNALAKLVSLPRAAVKASTFVMTIFESVIFPILPLILTTLGSKLLAKPKLKKILEATYKVLCGLLGAAEE